MAELNCNIEVDFDLEQVGCHWELTRYFRITWNVADGEKLYYCLGGYTQGLPNYKSIDTSKVYTVGNSYIYELPFSVFTVRCPNSGINLATSSSKSIRPFSYS